MITQENIFQYLKMGKFFKEFCPEVKNHTHKNRKQDGNGNPIQFSEADTKAIKLAALKLSSQLINFAQREN